jgi:hypothetical protein
MATISVYDTALTFQNLPPEEFINHLNNIARVQRLRRRKNEEEEAAKDLFDTITEGLFEPLDGLFPPEEIKQIIVFIAYAYSEDSKFLCHGVDTLRLKQGICDVLKIPKYLADKITTLRVKEVREVVVDYLEYQSNREFQHVMNKKIQYEAIMSASVKEMMGDDGKVDYKLMRDNNNMANELNEEIKKYEDSYKSRFSFAINGIEEIKKLDKILAETDKGVTSLSVESSREINRKI